ncbi:MAG: glycosyltransferase family 2 protein [Candidatus Poribacteria bacterium]|nr:glycosyltransferase family 2 protein [Candidatus Poribacteria bacterium]
MIQSEDPKLHPFDDVENEADKDSSRGNPIEVSVVIPCLNEAQTVGVCVQKALRALKQLGISGEVVVVDNGSTDGSSSIAESEGARVVHQPVRGYGSAYLAGIGAARGKHIIMGDADDTYDFSNLEPFLTPLKNGYDFVIGSRFQGEIHPGAMSWSHRYVGNPILSGILNLFFHAGISDAHCGMRSFTREAFERMKLQTLGMEFASEMVIRAIKEGLKILEIPIDYYPRQGESKLNSFRDAWRHLRFMLLYSPTHLFLVPGTLLFLLGLLCTFLLLPGPVKIGGHAYDIHVMTVTSILTLLGYQILHIGIYAKTYALRCGFESKDRLISGLYQIFNLEKGLILGLILFLFGFAMDARIAYVWIRNGFGPLDQIRPAILASIFMVLGVQTIFSAFFLSMLSIKTQKSPHHSLNQ